MLLAQDYARTNREIMLAEVLRDLRAMFPQLVTEPAINCHHNYLAFEEHEGRKLIVTRKGAIRAAKGDLAIFRARWGRAPTSSTASAIRSRCSPPHTARDAA